MRYEQLNEIFINETMVYRGFFLENKIFQNYFPTIGHGRQWGVQHDIPVKVTHEAK